MHVLDGDPPGDFASKEGRWLGVVGLVFADGCRSLASWPSCSYEVNCSFSIGSYQTWVLMMNSIPRKRTCAAHIIGFM